MIDAEKVIKGLETHSKSMHCNYCNECPYRDCEEEDENGDYEGECTFCLTNDALELLKAYTELQERHKFLVFKIDDMYAMLKEMTEEVKPFHKCVGGESTLIEDSGYNYCPYCGKKVWWE